MKTSSGTDEGVVRHRVKKQERKGEPISIYKMKIIKNYLKYSLWFVLTVFAALLGLYWLPAITIDGHTMRRVDILSDLRYPKQEVAAADSDSIPLPPVVKPAFC